MSSSLIRGKHVICKVDSGDGAKVIYDGAVFQRDGQIVGVGKYEDLIAKYQPDQVLGSADDVVIPGLVNSHHHVGLTPFQLGTHDHPLELWSALRRGARDVDLYLDTLYSAFEMIESGVTTVQHLHGRLSGPASRWVQTAGQVLKAYQDIGMRVTYAIGLRDQNRLVNEPDEDFVKRLPPSIAGEIEATLSAQAMPFEEQLGSVFVALWEHWGRGGSDRTRIQIAPTNLQWCSDGALMAAKEYADSFGVGVHMHLLETLYQKEYARRRGGTTAVRYLHDLGFLGPNLTFGHAVWLTEEDIALIAETGTMVCHNASSNLRLRSGIAPVSHLLSRGVRVAIGIDEAGINDDRDMLQEMRLVLNLHRAPGIEAPPTPAQVFRMATEHGAHTTGFGEQIGTLESGKAADLVVMDWKQIAYPYLDPDISVVDAVVHRARAGGVKTVLVGGEPVLRDRQFTRLNKQEVLEELARSLQAPLRPDELRRRELADQVLPHVKDFYRGWLDGQVRDPFYLANSRH